MRVVQVVFAGHIAVYLVWLMLTSRDHMSYDVTSIMDWVMVILEGVAVWMFINRDKIARPFVIAMAAIGLIVPATVDISFGTFNPIALVTSGAFYIFLIFYFIFSRRVKATLVNDLAKGDGDYDKDDFVINRRGWPFVRNLIIYFIVFSIIGHWMEMGMCQFIILGLVQGEYDPTNTMLWRDWLYPFPMEGAAVVVIALVLYPFFLWLKKKFTGNKRWVAYVISFFAGALLCTIIEGGMGLIVNADYQLWDYRENFMNIGGQVCLQNTAAFGVVAAIITWFVYPMLERLIARVPSDIMNIVAIVIFVFGAIIWSLYIIEPPEVNVPGIEASAVSSSSSSSSSSTSSSSETSCRHPKRSEGSPRRTHQGFRFAEIPRLRLGIDDKTEPSSRIGRADTPLPRPPSSYSLSESSIWRFTSSVNKPPFASSSS
ncbi:MAG: putative ABC transporter permease [Eggerthellaceae bacterium]|nr:putative ABC transporter permease [Eggerthellaceae bacterium]